MSEPRRTPIPLTELQRQVWGALMIAICRDPQSRAEAWEMVLHLLEIIGGERG